MASNTPNLNLLKKDPLTDGNETFNIQTMMNDNWDKIDTAVKKVQDDVANIDPDIPDASTTQKGIVQLSSATNSASETLAATAKAVKTVADASLPKTGGTVSGNLTVSGTEVVNGVLTASVGISSFGRIISKADISYVAKRAGARSFAHHISDASDYYLVPSNTADSDDYDFSKGMLIRGGDTKIINNGRVILDEIDSLKQSGVNAKASIVAAINAMGVAATTEASYSELSNKIRSINTFKELTASAGTYGGNSALIIPAGFKDAIRIYQTNILYNKWVNAQTLILYLRDSAGRVYELYRSNSSGNNLYGYTVTGININSSRIIVSGTNGASNPNSFNVQINFTNGFNMSDQFYIYNTNSVASSSTAGQQTVTTSTAYGS